MRNNFFENVFFRHPFLHALASLSPSASLALSQVQFLKSPLCNGDLGEICEGNDFGEKIQAE